MVGMLFSINLAFLGPLRKLARFSSAVRHLTFSTACCCWCSTPATAARASTASATYTESYVLWFALAIATKRAVFIAWSV